MIKSALWYQKNGFSIIPIKTDSSKKPLVEWTKYETEKPSEQQIKEWWTKWSDANIGIITGKISGITVFDIDLYKMEENEKSDFLDNFPPLGTPTAISPRGGEHRYFAYSKKVSTKNGIIKHVDVKNDGGYVVAPPSKNGRGKYVWQERKKISDLTPRSLPLSYINIMHLYKGDNIGEKQNRTTRTTSDNIDNIGFNEGLRDQTLFHLANHLVRGGMNDANIRKYLEFFAYHCDPPFPEKEINEKIKSALKRHEAKDRNLTQEIRDLIVTTSGNISTTFAQQMTTMTTREGRKKVNVILQRLEKEGLLERTGRIAGEYRIVDKSMVVCNLNDVEFIEGIDVRLPFFLEEYVEILPKDVIVFAGEPNSGKTAILLDTARMNMHRHKCWYFSTEMSKYNAKKRITKHDQEANWKLNFVESPENFYDIIQPDDFNFIDYLEVPENKEIYDLPKILAGIQRRLKTGIAIVAMQKKKDTRHAFGGQMTTAKPSLFCSIEPDFPGAKMRIIKAKNFKDQNPHDWLHDFKIYKGINIISEGDWYPDA